MAEGNAQIILVVEDDPGIRESVVDCLAFEGYAVEQAGNGEEALALLHRSAAPCLIVLDLVMPVMNGTQFLVELRDDPGLRDIPVVLMTAATPSAGMPMPRANGYLAKPFELDDLLDAIERHALAVASGA